MSFLSRGQVTKEWIDISYDSTTSINADNLAYDSTSTIKQKVSAIVEAALTNVSIDTFTLNSTNISNGYVDLTHQVNNDDIDLTIAGAPGQKYGIDYTLITPSRLSWTGLGLSQIPLETGDVLTVVYKTSI